MSVPDYSVLYDPRFMNLALDGHRVSDTNPLPVDVTPAAPSPGDYLPVRLTNGVSFYNATGGGGGGGASMVDKTPFAEGTDSFTPVGGVFNDALGADLAEDEAGAARLTAKRALHVNLRKADATELGTASAPIRTDPTGGTPQPASQSGAWSVTANQGGSWTVTISGTVTVTGTVAATQSGAWSVAANQGGSWTVVIDDGGGSITVDGTVAATQSGAWSVTANQGGSWTVSISGTVTVAGTVAATQSGGWTVAATQSGAWSVSVSGTVAVDQVDTASLDFDTGAGTVLQTVLGIALPGAGGPVAGGTASAPVRTDPTGTTPQPASQSGSWTVTANQGGSWTVSVSGTVTVTGTVAATQSGSWTVTANQGGSWTVSISGTVTVAGTVTANQGGSWTVAATQSGAWSVSITGTPTVDQVDTASLDFDTGAGTVLQSVVGVALPGAGGPVAGGTATDPLRTDPTGTTPQPVTDAGGSLTVDGTVAVSSVGGTVAATQSGGWTVAATQSGGWSVSITGTPSVDVTDRAARLLGVVYGSQGAQLKQTATNNNLAAELAVGGTLIDPRQIRALTASDVVTANQGGSWTVAATQSGAWTVAATQSGGWTVTANQGGSWSVTAAGSKSNNAGAPGATNIGALPAVATAAVPSYTEGNQVALSTDLSGNQRITGTVTANQGGSWTVAVSGSVTVAGTVAVSSVAGTVTVAGTVAATQSGGWTVAVSGEVDVTPASPDATSYLPIRLTDGSAFYNASSGGETADLKTVNGYVSQLVYDDRNRLLLEQVLWELSELSRRIFDE